jgi:hypothetical protein
MFVPVCLITAVVVYLVYMWFWGYEKQYPELSKMAKEEQKEERK